MGVVEFVVVASVIVLVVAGVLFYFYPAWRAWITAAVIASPIPPIP